MDTREDNAVDIEYFEQASAFFDTLGALLYTELSQEEIDKLAAMDFLGMAESMGEGDLADGLAGIGRYMKRRGVNVRQDLAVEYARIFLGAGADESLCAVPFESVFTSPDGLLMQDSRDEVVRIYRSCGMKVDETLNVPEDHLGFELQFMGTLCRKTADALREGGDVAPLLAVQTSFIDDHILNWVGELAERVEACSLSPFYPSVMKVVVGYCAEHRDALEEAVS